LNSLAPSVPTSLNDIAGEWELVLSTVPHGIFRSSPFFLAIQEAFAAGGEPEKANLFFQLHELQVMSWGASKIGRVAQVIISIILSDEVSLIISLLENLFEFPERLLSVGYKNLNDRDDFVVFFSKSKQNSEILVHT
jgi:hypothetical protein